MSVLQLVHCNKEPTLTKFSRQDINQLMHNDFDEFDEPSFPFVNRKQQRREQREARERKLRLRRQWQDDE